jgi:Uma2 family endonuclease
MGFLTPGSISIRARGAEMSVTTLATADELLHMPDDGHRYELVAGEITKMPPPGWRHGRCAMRVGLMVGSFAEQRQLGDSFAAETGFLLARDPDTVRAPDYAFIRKDHLPTRDPEGAYWPGPPDLAVEVSSPGDTLADLDDKVKGWLDAGAMMVWVVNPRWRSVTVYRSATDIKTLTENAELSGEDVVPNFRCQVAEIFGS